MLIDLSTDEVAKVRSWATFGLGFVARGDLPKIREALVARLKDADHETRGEAILGLAERGDTRVNFAIQHELASDNLGSLALQAIEIMPSKSFIKLLQKWSLTNPGDDDILRALEACKNA
jgi:HEAT repeat protein